MTLEKICFDLAFVHFVSWFFTSKHRKTLKRAFWRRRSTSGPRIDDLEHFTDTLNHKTRHRTTKKRWILIFFDRSWLLTQPRGSAVTQPPPTIYTLHWQPKWSPIFWRQLNWKTHLLIYCVTKELTAINVAPQAHVEFNSTELKLTFHCVTNDDANIGLQGFETDYPVITFHFLLAKKEGRTQEYNNSYLIQGFMNHWFIFESLRQNW